MAFDKINMYSLWTKLLKNSVSGTFLNIIKEICAKSSVNVNHTLSDYFVSNVAL